MDDKLHHYRTKLTWVGNSGTGTSHYRAYSRDHLISTAAKPDIAGSADPAFRGDAARWNPEELFVASIAACHQLWYLHLCAEAGLVVVAYEDEPEGVMVEQPDGAGQFTAIILRPTITITAGDEAVAVRLHDDAAAKCFLARSVNFPVTHEPKVELAA